MDVWEKEISLGGSRRRYKRSGQKRVKRRVRKAGTVGGKR